MDHTIVPKFQLCVGVPQIAGYIASRGQLIGKRAFFNVHDLKIAAGGIELGLFGDKFRLNLVQLLIQISKGPV